jgi:hypothetical protein
MLILFPQPPEVIGHSDEEETIDASDGEDDNPQAETVDGSRDNGEVVKTCEHNSQSKQEVDDESHHLRGEGFGEVRMEGENGTEIEKLLSVDSAREDS